MVYSDLSWQRDYRRKHEIRWIKLCHVLDVLLLISLTVAARTRRIRRCALAIIIGAHT